MTIPSSGVVTLNYYLDDHLGTAQVELDASGAVTWQGQFTPFGSEVPGSSTTTMHYKFTGKERDAESGLDFFGARYYASPTGRWMSPDPGAVNLRHLVNPQKWNKYSYVLDNPLSSLDPDGKEEVKITLRAFIPQATVGGYRGDNRTFSTDPGASSRTSISFTIETDRFKRGGTNPMIGTPDRSIGETHFLHFFHMTAKALPFGSAQYNSHGLTDVNIHEDVVNPLAPPGTPPIHADFNITFARNGEVVDWAGNFSRSPAFEVNIEEGGKVTNIPIQGASSNFAGFAFGLFSRHDMRGDPGGPGNQGQGGQGSCDSGCNFIPNLRLAR